MVALEMPGEQDASAAHLQGELGSHNGAEKEGRPQQLVHGEPNKGSCKFVNNHIMSCNS